MRSLVLFIERAFLGGCEFYDEGALFFERSTVGVGVVEAPAEDAAVWEGRDVEGAHLSDTASLAVAVGAGIVLGVRCVIHDHPLLLGALGRFTRLG